MKRVAAKMMILFLLAFFIACSNTHAVELTLNNTPAQVYFSPSGGATDAVVKEISKANQKVFGVRINSELAKRLKLLAVKKDTRVYILLEEAIADLLRKYKEF